MKIAALFIAVCCFIGCKSDLKMTVDNLEVKEILIDPEKTEPFLDLCEILTDSVDIIPLETTEECLLSEINKIEFYKNRIYISDRANAKIFVFTPEGKYLKSIGRQGMGPNEYSFLGDFTFIGDSIAIQDRSQRKYILYNLYDDLCREVFYDAFHVEIVSFDNIAYFIANNWPTDYGDFNFYKYDFNSGKTLSYGMPFDNSKIDKSGYGLKRHVSQCFDESTLIFPLNDTIYTLKKDSVYPSYVVHFTSRNLPEEIDVGREQLYRFVRQNKYLKGVEYLQNSKDYLMGLYIYNSFNYFLYNKKESTVVVGKSLRMSLFGNLLFHEFYTTKDNELCIVRDTDMLSDIWRSAREGGANEYYQKKMDQIVEKMKDDSNPILFRCRFK